jgi:ribonuclease R
VIDYAKTACSASSGRCPTASGSLISVDKKWLGSEVNIGKADNSGPEDGDLVIVDLVRTYAKVGA